MKLLPHPDLVRSSAFVGLAFLAAGPLRAAQTLIQADWQFRQAVTVAAPGLVRVELPPATLDAARPGLEDLRLVDPTGRETPYLLVRSTHAAPAPFAVRSFGVVLANRGTVVMIGSDGTTPLAGVVLATPAPVFLKSATVESSSDGERWETVTTGAPVFRQFGAEKLDLPLAGRPAARVRVTLDDAHTRPVPVTGARLVAAPVAAEPLETRPLTARIVRREEFAAETMLTLDLGAAHLPLAAVEFATPEPLFMRAVTIAVRELRETSAFEHTLAAGSIYRVSVDGAPPSARLEIPLAGTTPARELLVHIANGDSPPLAIEAVQVRHRPVRLLFNASQTGRYTLLSGHRRVAAPRYDLAPFERDLQRVPGAATPCGPLEKNPAFVPAEPLAGLRIDGAPLDVSAWKRRRSVHLVAPGVQQLELDLDVLSHMQPNAGDLRLLQDGRQLPYLLERPALARPLVLALTPSPDPKRPSWSFWKIKLPFARLPLTRLTLATTTPFFQRHLRLYERIADQRGHAYDHTLADAEWSRPPDGGGALTLSLSSPPQTDTLILEIDNGDNPPLVLAAPQGAFAVVRLLFKADAAAPLELCYGHPIASVPRYDLQIVAPQILRAEKHVATLAPRDAPVRGGGRTLFDGYRNSILFWGTLTLVVVVLFFAIARLLPKPPPPS
jgi:hypothetical protein